MRRAVLLLVTLSLLVVGLVGAPAAAGPQSPSTAVVSLGDSFISGEAGRWEGNSLKWWGDRDGTDRAARCYWWGCDYDARRVYGSSYDNGCDRADVAPIHSSGINVHERINLACSGAQTRHIWREANGGEWFKGEPPQADQLAQVAAEHQVALVVLTVTANDLGFSTRVINCASAWSAGAGPCWQREQAAMDAAMPAAQDGLRKAIDEVHAVMAGAGYAPGDWRFVLAGYASPIPRGRDIRYPESGWSRLDTGGCPFYDADADWAKLTATSFIVDGMRAVAAEKGVQFLDVRDALNRREVCHKASSLVSGGPPSDTEHEWVRWVNSGCCQGDARESLHPNAFGQRALGRCLGLLWGQATGNWTCRNSNSQGADGMSLHSIS